MRRSVKESVCLVSKVANTNDLTLAPTIGKCEVAVLCLRLLFDLQQDGFCTLVVLEIMAVNSSVS